MTDLFNSVNQRYCTLVFYVRKFVYCKGIVDKWGGLNIVLTALWLHFVRTGLEALMCINILTVGSIIAAYMPSVSLALALVASVTLGAWCGVRVITAWENCDLWCNSSRTKSPSWRTRPPSWSCFTVNSNVKSYYSRSEENSCCARLLFNQPFSVINMGLGRSSDGLSRKSSGDRCIKIFLHVRCLSKALIMLPSLDKISV